MLSSRISWVVLAIASAPFSWMNRAIAGTFYSITELPFKPADLNNFGDVVGQQYLWHQGTLFDIRSFPGSDSTLDARGINDNGWIVGGRLRLDPTRPFDSFSNSVGFIYDRSKVTPVLQGSGSFPLSTTTSAVDVNNQNQVVVIRQSFTGTGVSGSTTRIEPDGSRTALFESTRFGPMLATGVNNAGQAVGNSLSSGRTGPGAAYISDGRTDTPLITSGYCSPFADFIVPRCEQLSTPQPIANAINDRGQVVGGGPLVRANQAPIRAVVWEDPANNPIGKDLGSFGQVVSEGASRNFESLANGINNTGDIVGYAYAPSGERRAVIWQNGQLFDLNDRVALDSSWKLTNAVRINDAGQIIGVGLFNGEETGFLLSPEPIPEPDQTMAAIAGFGTMLALVHFKRRTRSKRTLKR